MAEAKTALVKYKENIKEIARVRAGRKVKNFNTIMSRLNYDKSLVSRAYRIIFLIGILEGLVSMGLFADMALANFLNVWPFFIVSIPECIALFLFLSTTTIFLSLIGNKMDLPHMITKNELKMMDAEEECLSQAKKKCLKYPNNVELQREYQKLIAEILTGRNRDLHGDEDIPLLEGDMSPIEVLDSDTKLLEP